MSRDAPDPLLRSVDSVEVRVPNLDAGLAFYRDLLGQELRWRAETSAGLAMPGTDTELVIQTERPAECAFLVESADEAAARFVEAGGRVVTSPHDIRIGRCAVVQDPWGNRLVLLDMSKGRLVTDAEGNIIGNEPAS